MSDTPKYKNTNKKLPLSMEDIASPLNFLMDTREPNILEMQTLSSLFLMGESIAKPHIPEPYIPSPPITHARTEKLQQHPPLCDFNTLFDLLGKIHEWSESDPRHQAFLNGLRESIGAAGNLNVLFQNLFPNTPPNVVKDSEGKPLLTPRQLDVLREAGKDRTQKEIAKTLGIKEFTVNMHLQRIYKQLNCNRPMQAVAMAISMGYLETDTLAFIQDAGGCKARDFHPLGYIFSGLGDAELYMPKANLTSIAEFGLLLLALCGSTVWELQQGYGCISARKPSQICESNRDGDIVRRFGDDLPGMPTQVVVAPAKT